MTWIELLLDFTKKAESPRSYIYWSGLATISAIVKRKVYFDKDGQYNVYPNIYVLLIGPSGVRKGLPPSVAKRLVSMIDNTRIISGRSSIQAILSELSKTKTSSNGSGPITDACGAIISGEFSSSLVDDDAALTILTDLYDSCYHEGVWKNTLKSSPVEELKDPTLTILGALNETHFNDMITERDITGGFIGRCFLIQESKRAHRNSLIRKTGNKLDYSILSKYLHELSQVSGEFTMTNETMDFYDEWYNTYNPEDMEDKTGSANRMGDSIIKVAMLISLSRSPELIITLDDMKEAFDKCTTQLGNVNRITEGTGKSLLAKPTKIVMGHLFKDPDHKVTRTKLLRKYWGDFYAEDLDKVIAHLVQAQCVIEERIGNETVYTMTETVVDYYQKKKAEL